METENIKVRKRIKLGNWPFIICMLAYPVLQFLVFWVYVNIDTVLMTFQRTSPLTGRVYWAGLYNYKDFWQKLTEPYNDTLRVGFVNSLMYFVINCFICLPLSFICCYFFFKRLPGYKPFRIIFFMPGLISVVVVTMLFGFMLDSTMGVVNPLLEKIGLGSMIPANGWLGDKNTAQGAIFFFCVWSGIGGNIVLLAGAISRIPAEIFESAALDGISMPRELFQMILPLILPTLSIMMVTGSMIIFTVFLQPMLLTKGGPDGSTQTLAFYVVGLVQASRLEEAATAGICFSLVGIPMVQLIRVVLERLTPDVEY